MDGPRPQRTRPTFRVPQAAELSHNAMSRLSAYKRLGEKLEAMEPDALTRVALKEPAPKALQALEGDLRSGHEEL